MSKRARNLKKYLRGKRNHQKRLIQDTHFFVFWHKMNIATLADGNGLYIKREKAIKVVREKENQQ